jgi:hypothetical protein
MGEQIEEQRASAMSPSYGRARIKLMWCEQSQHSGSLSSPASLRVWNMGAATLKHTKEEGNKQKI